MSVDASNYDLQNVECKSLMPSRKISSRSPRFAKEAAPLAGLSQTQLQKSLEQYQKIPKSVVVQLLQHKIEVP